MRIFRLLLAVLPLLVSCGRLPSAPSTTAVSAPQHGDERSANAPVIGTAVLGDTQPAMPLVHSIQVERVGNDVRVALVGRPRSPGVHPEIGPLDSGGYWFGFHMVFDEPDQGNIYSIGVVPLDEHHVVLSLFPFGPAGVARDAYPVYSVPGEIFPLRGTGTSWSFRFPVSTAVALGGFHFRWRLILISGLAGAPGYSREDFVGTVDLSK